MDKNRIYGEKVAIDQNKVKDFYNRQVAASETKIGSVFLGSQDPGTLEEKNAYCRDHVLPVLDVNGSTRVLDLGCGIGRWAEFLLPHCGWYCGVDFCEEMIAAAKRTCSNAGGGGTFSSIACRSLMQSKLKAQVSLADGSIWSSVQGFLRI